MNGSQALAKTTATYRISDFLLSTRCRNFSSSSKGVGHYETLSLPRNATKSQIKSSFYRLSKEYHPDVSSDPNSAEKFQALTESYAILSDDRKRRAYDRTLAAAEQQGHHAQWSYEWSYETRRRGATHAWERSRRSASGSSVHPGSTYGPYPRSAQDLRYGEPFPSSNARRASGVRTSRRDQSEAHKAHSGDGEWRALRVILVVLIIATFGGGWSASASGRP